MKHLFLITVCLLSLNYAQAQFWGDFRIQTNPPIATIPTSSWQNVLNQVFSGSSVRLNNYTPIQNQYYRNDLQFFKPGDSYFQLRLNDRLMKFDIPIDMIPSGQDNMFKMYINDWNSRQLIAGYENGNIKITLLMEDEGMEVIGNCYNHFLCGFTPTPSFNYTNSKIDIYLQLISEGGRLSYNANAIFSADVIETGPCVNNLFAAFCPPNRSGFIKAKIEGKLNEYLNAPLIKAFLIQTISNLLPANTAVTTVKINNGGDIQIW